MDCNTPGFPVHYQLPEFTQTQVHQFGDAIQPSHPLSSPLFLPSIFPSIRVLSNESVLCIRWPKYWSFSFNISPSNEHSGLVSFRMDWLDLLAVQGTLKSLLQHHSSEASILQRSAFFIVQLSHPYMCSFLSDFCAALALHLVPLSQKGSQSNTYWNPEPVLLFSWSHQKGLLHIMPKTTSQLGSIYLLHQGQVWFSLPSVDGWMDGWMWSIHVLFHSM